MSRHRVQATKRSGLEALELTRCYIGICTVSVSVSQVTVIVMAAT